MSNAIVLISDSNYIHYLKFMLFQLKKYNSLNNIYILTNNSSYDIISKIHANTINMQKYYIEYNFDKQPRKECIIYYNKLMIPLIDKLSNYDKILYIDCDIEIVKDFKSIFNITFSEEILACLNESINKEYIKKKINPKLKKINKKYLDFKNNFNYINAGVLIFNNKLIRNNLELYKKRVHKFLNINKKCNFLCGDEEIINLMYNINYSLPKIYNRFYRFLSDSKENYIFIHYTSKSKESFNNLIKNYT